MADSKQPAFQPFIPASEKPREFTFRAILLGSIFGIIFGAVTVYVGLRAGLTVAASIPIAVLSISILRAFGRASILENNIVQTTGNAGQSIASGVIFTLPALVFLGFDLEYSRIFMLALIGGWLGVLFMIPLRRQLIVQEHDALPYPEGTACADVLIAGERGGSLASRVFLGLGLGGVYTLFQNSNLFQAWPHAPEYQPDFGAQHVLKGASINADATSEYLGVGYIIGPKVAGVIFAGGVFSWLVVMPLIYFFGKDLGHPVYPGQVPIAQMTPSDLWAAYIKPMGAGAVAAAGLITLIKTLPTIFSALGAGFKNMRSGAKGAKAKPIRTEDDLVDGRGAHRLRCDCCADVCVSGIQAGARRIRGMGREPGRFAACGRLRISLRHGQLAHRGPGGFFGEPGFRHDHRHANGHVRNLSGQWMDQPGFRRSGHHHRRRGVHCRIELGRHLAGFEDWLHRRLNAAPAADRADDRRGCFDHRDRVHVEPDEHRPAGVSTPPRSRGTSTADHPGVAIQSDQNKLPAQIRVVAADKTQQPPSAVRVHRSQCHRVYRA